MLISDNGDDMRMSITFSVYRRIVCLQSDISNYWPGMLNTAFLIVFAVRCEQGVQD